MSYPSYLVHFNPYHDPKNGRFTFNKDSENLANTMSRYADSYVDHLNNATRRYFVDKRGNVVYKSDGTPVSILIVNTDKQKKWKAETDKYLAQKELLKKKYKDVTADAKIQKNGNTFITVTLTDFNGNKYTSTRENTYKNVNVAKYDFAPIYK